MVLQLYFYIKRLKQYLATYIFNDIWLCIDNLFLFAYNIKN